MKKWFGLLLGSLVFFAGSVVAEEDVVSELTCADFLPTPEALERFPYLAGACESVIERDGELFGLFRAIVRSPGNRTPVLSLPATDKTVRINPDSDSRVVINGRKLRPSQLERGQEIRIYLSVNEFAKPNVTEVVLVSETDALIEHVVEPVAALPTTG